MANDSVAKLKKIQAEAAAIFNEKGMGFQDEHQMSPLRRTAHFWVLVIRSFLRNRCPVRASALAYTTLLALIPLLAVVISVSSSLLRSQGEKPIEGFIDKLVKGVAPQLGLTSRTNVADIWDELDDFPMPAATNAAATTQPKMTTPAPATASESQTAGQREVASRIFQYINNVRSGTLGATGVISLILVAILLLSNIEKTFNDIWGVGRGRSWFARVVQYWAAITLGPLILIVALGLTSGPFLTNTEHLLRALPVVGKWLIYLLSMLTPFLVLTSGFALFYGLMPNTRVQWRAALAGGAVGGCLWQFNNLFNVIYVSKVVTYSKIYGSFSMVPLFLIGMYFSWLILLFGAQVSYAFQNRLSYRQERQAEGVNQRGREFVALRAMTLVGRRFQKGERAPTVVEMSNLLGVPSRLVTHVLHTLVGAGLLMEVALQETGYAPARPLNQITCQDILQAMRVSQGYELATNDEPARALVRQEFERINLAEQQAAAGVTLQSLVDRLPAQ
jgi:membrane protein